MYLNVHKQKEKQTNRLLLAERVSSLLGYFCCIVPSLLHVNPPSAAARLSEECLWTTGGSGHPSHLQPDVKPQSPAASPRHTQQTGQEGLVFVPRELLMRQFNNLFRIRQIYAQLQCKSPLGSFWKAYFCPFVSSRLTYEPKVLDRCKFSQSKSKHFTHPHWLITSL